MLKGSLGKLLYGAIFVVVLPAALFAWVRATAGDRDGAGVPPRSWAAPSRAAARCSSPAAGMRSTGTAAACP